MQMKLLAFIAMSLLLSIGVSAQVKWVGAGDGVSWIDAANWSTAAVPVAGEDIILDNSVIGASYDVSLPADASIITINSITINPIGPSVIRLLVPASNTADPALETTATGNAFLMSSGSFFINASGSNITIDGNLQLAGTANADLSSGTGSPTLTIQGNLSVGAANSITESGTGNPVILLNGNKTQTISSVAGAFTGNNLDVIVNTTGTINLLTSVFLPHSLSVQAGTVDISNGTLNNYLGVRGDLKVDGTITESGTGLPRLILNGTANQNITVSAGGSITGDNLEFRLNNAAGATLLSDLVLPYWYSIVAGNITLGNNSMTTTFVQLIPPVNVMTSHIVTNGTGFLIIPDIVSNGSFPIGADAASVNEVGITNGEGLTYSIRVNVGINPPISLPLYALNRTWTINTNGVPVNPINVTFYYYPGQGTNNFDYASTIDVGQYTPSAWSIIKSNIPPSISGTQYQIASLITSFNTPFVIGNHGAILPLDFLVICKAQKKDTKADINWNVGTEESVSRFEIEKSLNGSAFKSITTIFPTAKMLNYHFSDNNPTDGANLYRVKVFLNNGKVRYSNTVALVYNSKGFLITSIVPNPVVNNATVTVSSPLTAMLKLLLYDAQGKLIMQWQQRLTDGTNIISLPMSGLINGIYFLSATDGNSKTNVMRVVKQ